jgi:anti-anti-sigma regulatory factor
MADSLIKLAPTADGCCLRVEGSGTLRHSPAARDAAARVLGAADSRASVTFDLSACDYLDSTFLGLLIDLYRQFGKNQPAGTSRYAIAAPPDKRRQLFGPTHLDRLIPMLETAPPTLGPWLPLADRTLSKVELARHVMEAHRALAQIESPLREVFARIANEMESEIQ